MTIVRWRPFSDLLNLHGRINQLFENEFRRDSEKDTLTPGAWTPPADIYETKDEYVFKLELPGISKDEINIEFANDTLTIKGERKEEKEVKQENYHRVERCCGSFVRSFSIPKNIDAGKIDATMKDGILELRVPKVEEAKAKAIPIKVK
jgi:HSP20 family protein